MKKSKKETIRRKLATEQIEPTDRRRLSIDLPLFYTVNRRRSYMSLLFSRAGCDGHLHIRCSGCGRPVEDARSILKPMLMSVFMPMLMPCLQPCTRLIAVVAFILLFAFIAFITFSAIIAKIIITLQLYALLAPPSLSSTLRSRLARLAHLYHPRHSNHLAHRLLSITRLRLLFTPPSPHLDVSLPVSCSSDPVQLQSCFSSSLLPFSARCSRCLHRPHRLHCICLCCHRILLAPPPLSLTSLTIVPSSTSQTQPQPFPSFVPGTSRIYLGSRPPRHSIPFSSIHLCMYR